jgi:hypothetical protein
VRAVVANAKDRAPAVSAAPEAAETTDR